MKDGMFTNFLRSISDLLLLLINLEEYNDPWDIEREDDDLWLIP